jgi:hypothetical protein
MRTRAIGSCVTLISIYIHRVRASECSAMPSLENARQDWLRHKIFCDRVLMRCRQQLFNKRYNLQYRRSREYTTDLSLILHLASTSWLGLEAEPGCLERSMRQRALNLLIDGMVHLSSETYVMYHTSWWFDLERLLGRLAKASEKQAEALTSFTELHSIHALDH